VRARQVDEALAVKPAGVDDEVIFFPISPGPKSASSAWSETEWESSIGCRVVVAATPHDHHVPRHLPLLVNLAKQSCRPTTLPRSGSRVRIPSPAPIFFKQISESEGSCGVVFCFPASGTTAREAGGSRQRQNVPFTNLFTPHEIKLVEWPDFLNHALFDGRIAGRLLGRYFINCHCPSPALTAELRVNRSRHKSPPPTVVTIIKFPARTAFFTG
jgi:hypothetical protein